MYVQNIVQGQLLCLQSVSGARGTVTPCDGRCLSRLDVRGPVLRPLADRSDGTAASDPGVLLLLSHVRVGTWHLQPRQCIAVKLCAPLQELQGAHLS